MQVRGRGTPQGGIPCTTLLPLRRALGIPESKELLASLFPAEQSKGKEAEHIQQVCVDSKLGALGTRALAAAVLGKGQGMKSHYPFLRSLRFWEAETGDAGVAAVAALLKVGPPLVALGNVEFMNCGVGPEGCWALGDALMLGANTSLQTLSLDINPGIADAGTMQLCEGLRSNPTLTKLQLSYCEVAADGAAALAEVLSMPTCALKSLDLSGNRLGSEGLASLASGLAANTSLEELNLADNGIGATVDDAMTIDALTALGEVLVSTTCPLAVVDLTLNSLDAPMAEHLVQYLGSDNTKVRGFLVDAALPPDLYDKLLRLDKGKKKKKKKKGGKKKK